MFSVRQKREIADKVQLALRQTRHPELPDGEIEFELHVHGREAFSWADIRNNGAVADPGVNPHNEASDPESGEYEVVRHFVRFLSPGTFVAEESESLIESWDVEKAKRMAKRIVERHGARPYAFQFLTRGLRKGELDSSVVSRSAIHYLRGVVLTLAEAKSKYGADSILVRNMEANRWSRVIEASDGRHDTCVPFGENDVLLSEEG